MPVDNNWYWKSEDEDSTKSTETSDQFAREGGRRQFSIPVRCGANKQGLGKISLYLENIKGQTSPDSLGVNN